MMKFGRSAVLAIENVERSHIGSQEKLKRMLGIFYGKRDRAMFRMQVVQILHTIRYLMPELTGWPSGVGKWGSRWNSDEFFLS